MADGIRICPVCVKTKIVAANVEICGICQYRLFDKNRIYKDVLKRLGVENRWWSNLNAGDLVFLAKHLEGCPIRELSLHLGKCKNAIRNSIIRGKLEGNCEDCQWRVAFVGIIWAVYISSGTWVTFPQAAKIAGVDLQTIHSWYKEGLLGKARINLSSRQVINRVTVEKLSPTIKAQKRQNSLRGLRQYLARQARLAV